MIFTEHEMTLAVQGAVKQALSLQAQAHGQEDFDADAAFASLGAYERYQVLSGYGDVVLPVLAVLPEVDVEPDTKPEFTQAQVEEAVDATINASIAVSAMAGSVQQASSRDDALRRAATCGVVGWALAALPVRKDLEAFVVPDTLEGL